MKLPRPRLRLRRRTPDMSFEIQTGGSTYSFKVPRDIARQLNAMMRPPKTTSPWAPRVLVLLYLAWVASLPVVILVSNPWVGFTALLAAYALAGINWNIGMNALRRVIRLERDLSESRKSAGNSPYPPWGALPVSIGGARAGADEGARAELVERADDMPLLAHKMARLKWDQRQKRFALSSMGGVEHQIDAEARCLNTPLDEITTHEIPDLDCTCGFYACRVDDDEALPPLALDRVLLVVELSGKVVVFERGYRAQFQRILSARMECCGCKAQPDVLAVDPSDGEVLAFCNLHADDSIMRGWMRFRAAPVFEQLGIEMVASNG